MKKLVNLQPSIAAFREMAANIATEKLTLYLEEKKVREMINFLQGMLKRHPELKRKIEVLINFNFPWEKTPREIKVEERHETVAKKFQASFYEAILTPRGYSQLEVWEEILSAQEVSLINEKWNSSGVYIAFRSNSAYSQSYNFTICTKEEYNLLPNEVKKRA